MKFKRVFLYSVFALAFLFLITNASAELNATWCCQKTTSGLYCQNAPQSECAAGQGLQKAPTICASTSYCKNGICYNPNQGTCADNTPQFVCEQNGGKWSATPIPQCDLGCCLLGDQAAFVTLVRCNYLAGALGLTSNFNKGIKDETQCILSAQMQDKGACVFESSYVKTCKFTTREECNGVNGTRTKGEFFKDKLCSAPELGTNCGKTNKVACVPGKEEVYFVDTCGNPANIYDSSKLNSVDYWSNVQSKAESCNSESDNINSKACGNCNYIMGSICRSSQGNSQAGALDSICTGLNCNSIGKKHGESWCVYNDKGTTGEGKDAVGSRFYKHICVNGQEIVEPCADFRQEECIQDSIDIGSGKTFSQAACRVNRWQDCIAQDNKEDCENGDKRDCLWKSGITTLFSNSTEGTCIPKNPPGLNFWDASATAQCAVGTVTCVVKFEKSLLGSGDGTCTQNCECLTDSWLEDRKTICSALGDCGPNINWLGQSGWKPGFTLTVAKNNS